ADGKHLAGFRRSARRTRWANRTGRCVPTVATVATSGAVARAGDRAGGIVAAGAGTRLVGRWRRRARFVAVAGHAADRSIGASAGTAATPGRAGQASAHHATRPRDAATRHTAATRGRRIA